MLSIMIDSMSVTDELRSNPLPEPRALLRLIKPVTWFPPMWAFLCGAVASGAALGEQLGLVFLGLLLTGPLVCGMSQAANDWCDRHVDAINEPDRPIPSGRVPGRWGLWVALAMSALALMVAWPLGYWGFAATCLAVAAAWAYSAEPLRLKRSWLWGPGLVGLCYEGLPWITGAAILAAGTPSPEALIFALIYALGAHGIMTLNDFKALEGDLAMGIRSLPAVAGPAKAAWIACAVMTGAQGVVIALLFAWDRPWHAGAICLLLLGQVAAMRVLMRDPKGKAPWYNGAGVTLYVAGMMICAFAIRGMGA